MPAIVRLNDLGKGHSCWPPVDNNQASLNVFVNLKGVHRVGDTQLEHCCGDSCHIGVQTTGSPNVFVNSKAVARIGDLFSCTDHNAVGSPNTFAN